MECIGKDEITTMTREIGFCAEYKEEKKEVKETPVITEQPTPCKSMVRVQFLTRNTTLTYYNDKFDLQCGNLVYVEGCYEGMLGRVVEVNYNFKIKLSEYKKVIEVVDTTVQGELFMAGSHLISFDRNVIPKEKIIRWFLAPEKEEEEYASGFDDTSFPLETLEGFKVSEAIAERGHGYYMSSKVRYLCVDGTKGYAIVEGGHNYEVEFEFRNGEISNLICSCFCSYNCKHEVATLMQLRETLEWIEEHYNGEYEEIGYFATICKGTLFSFTVKNSEAGKLVLQ